LFKLQKRLWKAVRAGDRATARFLQRLILRSYGARLLAIRQVTQLNAGKKTAGVDGKANLTFTERFALEQQLHAQASTWKANKLRNVPIPKKNGGTRTLKVPTIADRSWQCLAKYAIEPAHEANFNANSYGFRPGRSAHDAQKQLFLHLNSRVNGKEKRILELDIEKCFDKINHNALMTKVVAPPELKLGLWRTLKAGAVPGFPDEGTPQGGVISPLLANIALDGIENIGRIFKWNLKGQPIYDQKGIRYADDMIFVLKPEDDANEILRQIKQHLATVGLEVNKAKSGLVASTDGFNFLGWHFKVKANGKFSSRPSDDNYDAFRKKIKAIVNCSNYGAKVKADKLAPIVRGWKQYHKYCDMNGARESLWHINQRAFQVFNRERKQNRHSATSLVRRAFPFVAYKNSGFVKVKGDASPSDGDITYWAARNSKHYDGPTAKALRKQNHTCGHCGQHLLSNERVHLHHVDGNHSNWKPKNLLALHQSCHQYHHMSNR